MAAVAFRTSSPSPVPVAAEMAVVREEVTPPNLSKVTCTMIAHVDENGRVWNIEGRELGTYGATLGCLGDVPTMGKTIETVTGLVGVFTSAHQVGAFDFGAAGKGFGIVGSAGSFSSSVVKLTEAGRAMASGKVDHKCWENLSKGVADAADTVVTLGKMEALTHVVTIYAAKVIKYTAALINDGLTLWQQIGVKPAQLEAKEGKIDAKWLEAQQDENLYGMIKTITATVFHVFLALGAIFFVPLPAIATVLLATACAVTATIHHFVKSKESDIAANLMGAQLAEHCPA